MGREVGGIISGPSRAPALLLLALSEKRDQKVLWAADPSAHRGVRKSERPSSFAPTQGPSGLGAPRG